MGHGRPLNYYSQPERVPFREVARVLFWLAFYGLGAVVTLFCARAFGNMAPTALLFQALIVLWLTTLILHIARRRQCYLTAAAWTLLFLLPTAYWMLRWLRGTYDMITGTTANYNDPYYPLFHGIFTAMCLLVATLCLMLVFLLRMQPWRASPN